MWVLFLNCLWTLDVLGKIKVGRLVVKPCVRVVLVMMLGTFLCGCAGASSSGRPGYFTESPQARDGVLDLRGWNWSHHRPIGLVGDWAFYWRQLLEPTDFADNNMPPSSTFVELPSSWNGYEIDGERLSGAGYATYYLRVLLDSAGQPLAFKMPEFETAYVLYVNGQVVSANGLVGTTPATSYPQWLPRVATFVPERDTLDIVLQISNFHHRLGGAGQLILLGAEDRVREARERALNFEFFLLGSLLIMSLYHVGLFVLRPKDHSPLYFALCCFLMAVRILVTGEQYLAHHFPSLNWQWLVRVNYLSFSLTVPMFALFTRALFPSRSLESLVKVLEGAIVIFASVVLLTPTKVFTHALVPYEIITLGASVYLVVGLVSTKAYEKQGLGVFIAGFFVMILAMTNDILYHNQIIETGYFGPLGVFFFIFAQSFLLAQRFSRTFKDVEVLSRDLEQRVAARTEELADSNQQLLQVNADLQEEIRERQRAEEDLLEAKEEAERHVRRAEAANRAKSVFIANVSHELRTPLNAIIGFSQLIAQDDDITVDQRENLDTITRSGEHLLHLINNVLKLSQLEQGQLALKAVDFDLYSLLQDLDTMFQTRAKRKRISLIVTYAPDVPQYVRTDAEKLRQVLVNLLSNAIQYTAEGQVVLRVQRSPDERPSDASQVWLLFEVDDTGPGMVNDALAFMSDAFAQTDSGQCLASGMGVGMPVSRQLARILGGELTIDDHSKLSRPDDKSAMNYGGPGVCLGLRIPVTVLEDEGHHAVEGGTQDRISEPAARVGEEYNNGNGESLTDGDGTFSDSVVLEDLPQSWIEALYQATVVADFSQMLDLAEQIRERDAVLANRLIELIYRFDYESVRALIGEASE